MFKIMMGLGKYLIVLSGLLILGCSEDKRNRIYKKPDLKEIEFLQFTKKQTIHMEALATSELILIKSCFKFKGGTTSIIFPASFYLDSINGKVVIKNGKKVVGIEGKKVSSGGGFVQNIAHLPITQPIKCISKEYFIVGQGFKLE